MQVTVIKTIPSAEKAEWYGEVKSVNPSAYFDLAQYKPQKLRSGLILKAANREAACSVAAAHAGTAAAEAEAA